MNHQYLNDINVEKLDYSELVNLLFVQMTPFMRKKILERLFLINEGLIKMELQKNLRNPTINTRRKRTIENPHPSITNKIENPIPLNMPINTKNYDVSNDDIFNLDDIIKGFNEENNLDHKLQKIKKLHERIINRKK